MTGMTDSEIAALFLSLAKVANAADKYVSLRTFDAQQEYLQARDQWNATVPRLEELAKR